MPKEPKPSAEDILKEIAKEEQEEEDEDAADLFDNSKPVKDILKEAEEDKDERKDETEESSDEEQEEETEKEELTEQRETIAPSPKSKKQKFEEKKFKKQQKTEAKHYKEVSKEHAQRRKKIITWAIIALVVIVGFIAFKKLYNPVKPYVDREIHWHALIEMEICGQKTDLPRVGAGEGHKGSSLLHTHDDNTIHVEGGPVMKPEEISLGAFMDAIRVPFDSNKLLNYTNGDKCPGADKQGKLAMYLNGKPTDLFRNYITKNGDKIKLVFE